MKHSITLAASIILALLILTGCGGLFGGMKSSRLAAGVSPDDIYPGWETSDRCTKCHMAWSWEYGYYRGWDRHGLISDYSKVSPAGYKDPYGLDVPVNTFRDYYYTDWWQGEWLDDSGMVEPQMRLDGYGRINDGTATPADFGGRVIVADASGDGDVKTIQAAIDIADSGSTVFVRPGTYLESVILKPGIRLWGQDAYTTIIDSENKASAVMAANHCDISGFTLTGTGFDYGTDRFRAAVHAIDCDSTLVVRGNIFFSNSVFGMLVESTRADGYSTDAEARYVDPENALENLQYEGYPNPRVIGNVFYNIGERAIYCIHSAPEIANNIFMGNLKTLGMTQLSRPFIHHNVFYRNTVPININRSMPMITRNIMVDNYWGQRIIEGALPIIHDNITWNSPYYKEFDEAGRPIVYNPVPGDGEREADPMFVDMDGGDFRFAEASPFSGRNTSLADYGLIQGPGIQVPPSIACKYSWADEFLNRTPDTEAIIAAVDRENARISSLSLAYSVDYRSFMAAEYDSSGNQLSVKVSRNAVSGSHYEVPLFVMDGEKRRKTYQATMFAAEQSLADSGTVVFDGDDLNVLSGRFVFDLPDDSLATLIAERPDRENIGGLYTDYDQYLNGSIGPAGTFYFGYLRILGGAVAEERVKVDGHECVVARYPHLGSDQVYQFYLDPALGYRPRRLEQYFDRALYRRIDGYEYESVQGVMLPVAVTVTDYAVKEPNIGEVIGITEMRVKPGSIQLNRPVDAALFAAGK